MQYNELLLFVRMYASEWNSNDTFTNVNNTMKLLDVCLRICTVILGQYEANKEMKIYGK